MTSANIRNRQTETAECGLAALGMAAHMAGSKIDLAWLRQRYPASSRGLNLRQLADIAGTIGFSTRAVRCEPKELKQLQRPSILHWGLSHFVVLDRVSRRGARVFDPALGFRLVPWLELSDRFTGVALELATSPEFVKRRERSPLKLSSLLRWTPALTGGLLQALLLSILLQLYVVASPFYIQLAVDEAALKGDVELLNALAIGFALFALFNTGADVLRSIALQRLTSLLNWDMTRRLFHHLVRLPLPWFQRRRLADALSRFQSLDPLRNAIGNGLVGAVIDGLLAIVTAIMMLIFAPVLAAITAVSFAVYVVIRLVGVPFTRRLSSNSLMASIAEQGKRIETLRSIQTIKAMGAENARETDWASTFAETVRTSQASAFATLGFSSVQKTVDTLSYVLTVYIGIRSVIGGHLTIGLLYAFLAYRTQFLQRATSLFEQGVNWRMLDIYTFRLADIVLTPVEAGLGRLDGVGGQVRGDVELRGVGFSYTAMEAPVFSGLNSTIKAGEYVAIVGPSGVGKSTLLKVISGLYEPTAGQVTIDGMATTAWSLSALRPALGIVLQDDDLLSGSIAENITFFSDHVDVSRVWECLRLVAIEEEVRQMPMRIDTFVGDLGSSLSGGQKQRLLLARALYKAPRILILDEATSHIDLPRERAINAALSSLAVTRIMVAHRPESVASADRILLLHNGLHEVQKPSSYSNTNSTTSQTLRP